jgi:hypothetical protein
VLLAFLMLFAFVLALRAAVLEAQHVVVVRQRHVDLPVGQRLDHRRVRGIALRVQVLHFGEPRTGYVLPVPRAHRRDEVLKARIRRCPPDAPLELLRELRQLHDRGRQRRRVDRVGVVGERAKARGDGRPASALWAKRRRARRQRIGQLGEQAGLLRLDERAGRVGPEQVCWALGAFLLNRGKQLRVGAVAHLHLEVGPLLEALHEAVHERLAAPGVDGERGGLLLLFASATAPQQNGRARKQKKGREKRRQRKPSHSGKGDGGSVNLEPF